MKKTKIFYVLLILTLVFVQANMSVFAAGTEDIYVSDTGSDTSGDGTRASPYKTLKKAENVINASSATDNDHIYLLSDILLKGV